MDQQTSFSLFNRISLKDKTIIARQLATMINAGLPIAQSLRTIQEQVANKKVQKMLEQVTGDIEGGSTLSVAFSRFPEVFSTIDITLVASGETSGTLDKALLSMAEQLEKEQSLMRKVRGAFIYPTFLLAVVVVVVVLMLIYVMPQMENLYSSFNITLPFLTKLFISISHILQKLGLFVILFIIGVILYIRYAISQSWGRRAWDNLKIKIPGVGELMKKLYMSRFAQTLSGLVGAGVPLLDALKIVSKAVGNVMYEELILEAAEKVKSGVALSVPLKNEIFPPVVSEMVAVGEKTGELDAMLQNLADYFQEEVDAAVKNISELIQPVLIVVMGGLIAIIMLAILWPIYNFGPAMNRPA
jgi:type IV pilus assembly protein PilC